LVGDSLGLSRAAAATDAEVIVFCGVHFMAETAKVLSPQARVLLPDLNAGCSLADTITADQLRAWKAEHPGAIVVSYVNTSAEVKAESDICCTSGNAAEVIRSIPDDREILFCPDMFLGTYLESITGRRMRVWQGECHVHAGIRPSDIAERMAASPESELLVHPECGCASSCMYATTTGDLPADKVHVLSTEAMLTRSRESASKRFIVATETGIMHRMTRDSPDKAFVALSERAICRYMKTITLEKLRDSLRDLRFEVRVPQELAVKARGAIERMVAIG
jgi:quinolinate synthase